VQSQLAPKKKTNKKKEGSIGKHHARTIPIIHWETVKGGNSQRTRQNKSHGQVMTFSGIKKAGGKKKSSSRERNQGAAKPPGRGVKSGESPLTLGIASRSREKKRRKGGGNQKRGAVWVQQEQGGRVKGSKSGGTSLLRQVVGEKCGGGVNRKEKPAASRPWGTPTEPKLEQGGQPRKDSRMKGADLGNRVPQTNRHLSKNCRPRKLTSGAAMGSID